MVLAINKMDLVGYSQDVYNDIVDDFYAFADELATDLEIQPIPMSALEGVNITSKSNETDWYDGPSLMDYLETVPVGDRRLNASFRMPVQWVNRPNLDFRGFSGQIAAGTVKPGDRVKSMPSGKQSTIQRIVTATGDLDEAIAGQSITLTLDDEIDCSRGDVLVSVGGVDVTGDHEKAVELIKEHGMWVDKPDAVEEEAVEAELATA